MNTLSIWCPTYKRPHKLQAVADNLRATTKNTYTLYFGVEPEDEASFVAASKVEGAVVIVNKYEMSYPNTIQTIYEQSKEPLCIHINDDFEFLPDWDEIPVSMFETPSVMVVGMRQHEGDNHGSAIAMFRRSYIEEQSGVIDMPNRVFYPYPHHYCDTEFTMTAQHRGVWFRCDKLVILHHHYGFTGAERDETYIKNDNTSEQARLIYESRKHLWE
jgi:hypothetical protein